ncbi:unnamed protein product [Haemonchus placei]|uniref:C2H2-type domain-containing protein n=1 Tax=Haemonchus placei TaxID=6290 RepID=A0A0N4WZY1_HAEPC|nr:unnamed protein product [Haemonchus placei]
MWKNVLIEKGPPDKSEFALGSAVVEEEERRDVSSQCCLCEEVFKTHEELSQHCGIDHLNDGAMGRPQDYVFHNVSFQSSEDFEVDGAIMMYHECIRSRLHILEFSTDYIIQTMRKDYESKECKLYFVTKKDLWNVMTKYKLTPGLRDRDDITSLVLREQERNPSDEIRFFKKQDEPSGKGFVLG